MNQLRAQRDKWFIVETSSSNNFAVSYLTSQRDILVEVGIRAIEDLPDRLKRSDGSGPVFVLWACSSNTSHKPGFRKGLSVSPSGDGKYSSAVKRICQRLEVECSKGYPNSVVSGISRSAVWRDAIQDLGKDHDEEQIHEVLDFVFGSEQKGIKPDPWWSGRMTGAPMFANNYAKLLDQKVAKPRLAASDRASKNQTKYVTKENI